MSRDGNDPLICYVVGLGHTGSTLLDLLISSHPEVTSVGEAKKLLTYTSQDGPQGSKRIDDQRCTCGVDPLCGCPFWKDVDAELQSAGLSLDALDLQSRDDKIFALHNRAFFTAVAKASGTRIVVDSSKSAVRLRRLASVAGLSMAPVHIVRSASGTVASYKKRGLTFTQAVSKYNRFTWVAIRTVQGLPIATVSLEALAADPSRVLSPLMRYLGTEYDPRQLDWGTTDHHNIHGNDMRFTTPEIRRPSDGRPDLTRLEFVAARAGCAPFELAARRRERAFLDGTETAQ